MFYSFFPETPLCVSTTIRASSSSPSSSSKASLGPTRMVMSLVNGGALVDFRSRDGSTAVHRAANRNNAEALKVLLDLGASPNYKASRFTKKATKYFFL